MGICVFVYGMFWIFIFGVLYIPNFVCAFTGDKCYGTIKEYTYYEGDVTIGAFFPLHSYYTHDHVPHEIDPYFFQDMFTQ